LGKPEEILGELVRRHGRRNEVIIATKGCHVSGGEKYPRPQRYMTPELLSSDINDSLERLRDTYIDLYYLHRDDPQVPVDEIMDALHEQQRAGRIRYYAASNWWPARLDEAREYCQRKGYQGFVASQVLYNVAQLTKPMPADICVLDEPQEQWYSRTKLPVFAYTSTANGYFAKGAGGSYDNPTSAARRARAKELADRHGASPTQIALAWLRTRPFTVIPILGTTNLEHLQDALGSTVLNLTAAEAEYLKSGAQTAAVR
jgi:aryl-alcohol dehydrogenase-like predicted oxidoreductase